MIQQSFKSLARGLTPPVLMELIRHMRGSNKKGAEGFVLSDNLVETPYGKFFFEDLASFRALYESYFQHESYRFEGTDSKPFIIDGGANIGVSCRYWKCLFPEAEVVAFEPDEHIFNLLQRNLDGRSGFTAKCMALWSSDGSLTFNAVGGEGGHLESVAPHNAGDFKRVCVPTFRLRNLLDRKVQLLKLDIEGAELEVLHDCKDRLQNVERVFVEHHSFLGEPQHLGDFFEILEVAGFRVHLRVDLVSRQPFLKRAIYNRKDSWINVFAFRE